MPRTTEDQLAMAGYTECPVCGEFYPGGTCPHGCRKTKTQKMLKLAKKIRDAGLAKPKSEAFKKDDNFVKSCLKFKEKE